MEKRLGRLEVLKRDLENFHGDVDAFSGWMGDAAREMDAITAGVPHAQSAAETENLLTMFKVRSKILCCPKFSPKSK